MNPFLRADGRVRVGWRVLLGILVAIAANMVAASLAAPGPGAGAVRFDLVYRPLAMLLLIGGFSLLEIFADQVEESPLAAQGLGGRHWGRDFALGLAIGAGLIAISIAVMAALGRVSFRLVWSGRALADLLAVLVVLATAALTEELMFRGYPFQRLVEAVGAAPAILLLSLLFGFAHARNPHVSRLAILNTLLVGVLLAVAYLRSRALWLPWGIHLAWNATLGVAFGLPVSGLREFAVVVKGTALGPAWLTGGAYGLEGSLLATVVIALGFVPVVAWFQVPARDLERTSGQPTTGGQATRQMEGGDSTSPDVGHPILGGSARDEGEHTERG